MVPTKNKRGNLAFVDEKNIPMVHQDDGYDDYNTPDTSRIDETSFTVPSTTEVTTTLRLRQNVKRDILTQCTGTWM